MNQFTKLEGPTLNVTNIVHISEFRAAAMLVLLVSEGLINIDIRYLQLPDIHTEI
jgi:hypothetical protein